MKSVPLSTASSTASSAYHDHVKTINARQCPSSGISVTIVSTRKHWPRHLQCSDRYDAWPSVAAFDGTIHKATNTSAELIFARDLSVSMSNTNTQATLFSSFESVAGHENMGSFQRVNIAIWITVPVVTALAKRWAEWITCPSHYSLLYRNHLVI